METSSQGSAWLLEAGGLARSGGAPGRATDEQDQPNPGGQQAAADGQQEQGVGAGEGQGPGRLGVVGVSPVTVKVAAQTGGRVANW